MTVSHTALRGNQEVLLAHIAESKEFKAIKERYLKTEFLGIDMLLHKIQDIHSIHSKKVLSCAEEIGALFHTSKDMALYLLLTPSQPSLHRQRYTPKISRDGNEVVIRIGPKTTQADIKAVWGVIKDLQRDIGSVGSKSSINPELEYYIHREHVLKGSRISEIFAQYQSGRLDGYSRKPTITDENDFRKYYSQTVKGL